MAARMAGPPLLVYRDGNASVGRHVGDRLIQFLTADIERLAPRTLRLLEFPDAFNIDHFGDGLVQDEELGQIADSGDDLSVAALEAFQVEVARRGLKITIAPPRGEDVFEFNETVTLRQFRESSRCAVGEG
jgi:hypothetical protein